MRRARWDPELRRIMDWELYLRLDSQGARFLHRPIPVGAYRVHSQQVSIQPRTLWESHTPALRHHRIGSPRARQWGLRYLGRGLHAGLKMREGAYRRQARSKRLRGTDLRWFHSEGAAAAVEALRSTY
jgi:hypothetical protein